MAKDVKITGLKKVAGETKSLEGYFSGKYLQLNYDKSTGKVWTDFFYSLGQNNWTEYHDSNIINCGNISEPMTMVQIREMVVNAL